MIMKTKQKLIAIRTQINYEFLNGNMRRAAL